MATYRFTNLLGATYKGGSLEYTPDGNILLSPVGNRVNAVDLVQGRCVTLAPENREDVAILALTQDAKLLLSIDVSGHALLINFVRCTVLTRINFKGRVQSAKWSPDAKWLIVSHGRKILLWRTPTVELGWQFVQDQRIAGHHDDIVDFAWAPNSQFYASCSKDGTVRLWSVGLNRHEGFKPMALLEHRSAVRGVFFSEDLSYIYSMSRDGCLVSAKYTLEDGNSAGDFNDPKTPLYCQAGTWAVESKAYCQQPMYNKVTRCDYDSHSRLLAVGFSLGVLMLFEMPSLQALQTLSLGQESLDAFRLGAKGDWLAVGSGGVGQLLVWEWRSETYVLKQQGHHWGVKCVAFSPGSVTLKRGKALATNEARLEERNAIGGRLLATGGYDGKVKLFNAQSGLCFVTFAEHTAAVQGICFTPQGNAVLSASADGSVRAFDLLRYRNFRTFASPEGLCQFSSLAVDSGGEIVAASAKGGKYAIYVWSIQTGNILEILTGHTSHVQCLHFSPSATHPGQLVSASWDGTLNVWDLYAGSKGGAAEALQCSSSVLCVSFDPRANDLLAASCLSGQILFWNVVTAQTVGSIDGLRDIQTARQWHEMFSAINTRGMKAGHGMRKRNPTDGLNLNQHYNSIAYAKSGEVLIASSQNSPYVSLYDTTAYALTSRVSVTTNRSLSGTQSFLNSKFMTEAGVAWQQYDLSDSDADDADVKRSQEQRRKAASLPGVQIGEAKDAYSDKQLHLWDVAFSADSQQFAVATTHGTFVFSKDAGMGMAGAGGIYGSEARFVPQMLTKAVSAPAVLKALEAKDVTKAMILALALNDYALLRKVYEQVPVSSTELVVASIGSPLLPALIAFLSFELKPQTGSPHYQFHVLWISALIDLHFQTLLEMTTGRSTSRTGSILESSRSDVAALCLQLLVELSQRHAGMSKIFENNTYLLRFLGSRPQAVSPANGEDEISVAKNSTQKGTKDPEAETPMEESLLEAEETDVVDKTAPKKKKKRRLNT